MAKILVTGGAGFIGSHLCETLLRQGHRVICMDNMLTGTYANISPLFENPSFEFINASVTEPISMEVDQIYNLACPASPIHYQYDPILTAKTNVLGALNVLELAKKQKARVLQASTSEVYGDPKVHPQTEDYWGNVNPIGPRACYDEGKRAAETIFFDYHRQYNVDIKVIRIFNTYGPKMLKNDGRVVSNFAVQALQGRDITIYGDGSQTRSFCYISDMISGMLKMMESEDFTGPVNLGNPQEITVMQLAEMILKKTNSKSRIVFKSLPENDPVRRKPCIDLAIQKLQWTPSVDIDYGLDKTIQYFKEI